MPPAEPSSAAPSAPSRRPLQITVSIPPAVAISAATTFERIPPVPSGEVVWPIASAPSASKSVTSGTSAASGSILRRSRVQPLDVGEQHEQVGADEHRDLRREEVVVAEGDLVGRRRVVLVDDRQHAPLEQLAERLARVEVVRPRAHVEERQQHLRARDPAVAQQLVVDAVELALPDGARGLQLLDRPRPDRQVHHPHPARDRAARDEHDVVTLRVARRRLGADALDDVGAQLAGVLGDDARSKLDDVARHGPAEVSPRSALSEVQGLPRCASDVANLRSMAPSQHAQRR